MKEQTWDERPLVFGCEGDRLIGIAAIPENLIETGVVIVVGGPQYRAGSHRQFTLLARYLAGENIASFRFDYRGMGDSEGDMRNFEVVDADIHAAVDTFLKHTPGVSKVVLWGLCDAASAALFYGHTDTRVTGLILLNPWVHSEAGAARVMLKSYYFSRLKQRSFWKNLLGGEVKLMASMKDGLRFLLSALGRQKSRNFTDESTPSDFICLMRGGFRDFSGKILFILSENDFTTREFQELCVTHHDWKNLFERPWVNCYLIKSANHTFASAIWRDEVSILTQRWLIGT